MLRTTTIAFSLGLALFAGCSTSRRVSDADAGSIARDGGGSALDPSRPITSLDATERRAFCTDFIARTGSMPTSCDGGITFRPQTVDQCAASVPPASCTATVGDVGACFDALGGDICGLFSTPQCAFFASCASSSGP